jgi:hypothetical protein
MKTLSSLFGAALLLAPALAHADDALPAPVVAAPAPVYFVPSGGPTAYAPSAPTAVAPTKSRNVALLISGIALASLGTASLVGGVVMVNGARRAPAPSSGEFGLGDFSAMSNGIRWAEGEFFAINGGLMMVSGVAMAIAGGWQVPVRARTSGSLPSMPAVAVGAGNATFKWSF